MLKLYGNLPVFGFSIYVKQKEVDQEGFGMVDGIKKIVPSERMHTLSNIRVQLKLQLFGLFVCNNYDRKFYWDIIIVSIPEPCATTQTQIAQQIKLQNSYDPLRPFSKQLWLARGQSSQKKTKITHTKAHILTRTHVIYVENKNTEKHTHHICVLYEW